MTAATGADTEGAVDSGEKNFSSTPRTTSVPSDDEAGVDEEEVRETEEGDVPGQDVPPEEGETNDRLE